MPRGALEFHRASERVYCRVREIARRTGRRCMPGLSSRPRKPGTRVRRLATRAKTEAVQSGAAAFCLLSSRAPWHRRSRRAHGAAVLRVAFGGARASPPARTRAGQDEEHLSRSARRQRATPSSAFTGTTAPSSSDFCRYVMRRRFPRAPRASVDGRSRLTLKNVWKDRHPPRSCSSPMTCSALVRCGAATVVQHDSVLWRPVEPQPTAAEVARRPPAHGRY